MTRTDVLIVGSGPIGSTFARVIGDALPGIDITMVELGPLVSEPAGSNVRNLPVEERDSARLRSQGPESRRAADASRSLHIEGTIISPGGTYLVDQDADSGMPAAALASCVGGMGVHWTCATPTPNDDERVALIPDSELRAAFAEAERLLHVTTLPENPYGVALRAMVNETVDERLADDRRPAMLPMSAIPQPDGGVRWGGADTVLGDTPVTLRADTLWWRLIHDGSRVTGVEVVHLPSGTTDRIGARIVVVAANALQTPQLLWASEIRPDALGRYLSEHIFVYSVVALRDEVVERAGTDVPVAELVKDPTASTYGIPYTQDIHPFRTQIMHMAHSPIPLADGANIAGPAGFVAMGNCVRKFPRPEDRLIFSETESDGWGMPRMRIEYELTGREHAEIEAATADLHRVAGRLGEFLPGGEPQLMPSGTSLHYKGTVRMGEDAASSVVNDRSRVWGFENLYLGGNGLIPTATTTNPTLTSAALAVRAATAIADSLRQQIEREGVT